MLKGCYNCRTVLQLIFGWYRWYHGTVAHANSIRYVTFLLGHIRILQPSIISAVVWDAVQKG